MPIYEYRCDNGHVFDVMQKMADAPVSECETCGAGVQRVFQAPAVHFKGSGFYNTDYGTAKRKREQASKSDTKKTDTASSKSDASSNGSSASGDSKGSSSSSPPATPAGS